MVQVNERGVIFRDWEVRATLAGLKTQFREVMKPQPPEDVGEIQSGLFHPTKIDCCGNEYPGEQVFGSYSTDGEWGVKSPYGGPGARLWVKETFRIFDSVSECGCHDSCRCSQYHGKPIYRVDADDGCSKWRPSIHMPRWASRITLEVVSVRVERLQEISESDAMAEGVHLGGFANRRAVPFFRNLWNKINGPDSWEQNPFVWVVEFKRINP